MELSDFPKTTLAHLPTPLEEMPRLANAINSSGRLWVKRDDCTGLAFGGNKTRKLEFVMADARQKGADVVITSGGVQSNHVRQTAAAAAKLGLEFHGVLTNPLASGESVADHAYTGSGNRLLGDVIGGEFHLVENDSSVDSFIRQLVESLKRLGKTPYVIPVGASNGIGALGYVQCAYELCRQFAEMELHPSHLFLATGSAGTHAGLLSGFRRADHDIQVIGLSVSEPALIKRSKVRNIMDQLDELFVNSAIVQIGDDEIVVALGAATTGRPHHRIGDRYQDLKELGHDLDNPAAV